jgi:hypothetical protein
MVPVGHTSRNVIRLGLFAAGLATQVFSKDSMIDSRGYLDIADPRAASILYTRLPRLATPVAVKERYRLHEFLIEPLRGNLNPLRKPELQAARERAIQKDNEGFSTPDLTLIGTGKILVGDPLAIRSESVTLPILSASEDRGVTGAAFVFLCLRRGPSDRAPDAGYVTASSDQLPFTPIIDFTGSASAFGFESRACVVQLLALLTTNGKHGLPKQIELSRAAAECVYEAPKSRVGWEVKATVFLRVLGLYPTDRNGYFQYPAFEIVRLVLQAPNGAIIAEVAYPETSQMPPPPWQK